MENEIKKRMTIDDVLEFKRIALMQLDQIEKLNEDLGKSFELVNWYSPIRLESRYNVHGERCKEKYVDQACWRYIVKLFELKKYMLCTEYDKMEKQIENFETPEFNEKNIHAYINDLKHLIKENVVLMVKKVYEELITRKYRTGGSNWNNSIEKKRNNNGVDNHFILTTGDYSNIFGYGYRPTITDDLEKVCYILDGEKLPDLTIKETMKKGKIIDGSCSYFSIRVCKNGNTHYTIEEETLKRLNKAGADPSIIGENIKIKVFEK